MKGLVSLLIALAVVPVQSEATSYPPPPVIQIDVFSDPYMGTRVVHVLREKYAGFGATIELPGGFLPKGDLYFGFLQPGNTNPHTWAFDGEGTTLLEGMHPFLEDIDLRTPPLMNTSVIAGKDIEHAFANTDPTGMYMVFVLIVIANTNPADHANWYGVETTPLFVE